MIYKYLLILSYLHLSTEITKIENLDLIKCKNLDYPITVNDISIEMESETIINFSGSLQTAIDITSPIQAQLKIKRKFLGIWLPIPCTNNLGSCKYPDLCNFGYPDDEQCPNIFIKNNVPCRCPIPKGNYTIKPSIKLSEMGSSLDGSYKGTISVNNRNDQLSCYNIKFRIVKDIQPEVIRL